ncbi:MAG: RNA 2'-phosphotransferase [Thiotrichaceae bacterium]|nr:RNA 2'-phosphotransferase [Thiotrichaceae bacterium]
MNEYEKKRIGKFMSLVLRHSPEKVGIELDNAGWADVNALLLGLKNKGRKLSFMQLEEIVETNDKKRYCFNEDKTRIRANQGHSLTVDLQLKEALPPVILYHGTASRFMQAINQQGLLKLNRHHVHLSSDKETAMNVGSRHGKPVIIAVAAEAMAKAGYIFYCSDNNVWLTDHVPVKYFS